MPIRNPTRENLTGEHETVLSDCEIKKQMGLLSLFHTDSRLVKGICQNYYMLYEKQTYATSEKRNVGGKLMMQNP